MISAQEARKISDSIDNEASAQQLADISGSVEKAAKNGKNGIYYRGELNEVSKKELTRLGYKFKQEHDQRENDSWWMITW